jgi:hypothetical protein
MFDQLTGRLSAAVAALRGRGRLTEANIADTLREVRIALLEADVALPVVKRFIEAVKARALGAEVAASLSPGQTLIGILHRELVALLGGSGSGLALNVQPPLVVLLAGLQGAGKTTTAGKLARWLRMLGYDTAEDLLEIGNTTAAFCDLSVREKAWKEYRARRATRGSVPGVINGTGGGARSPPASPAPFQPAAPRP